MENNLKFIGGKSTLHEDATLAVKAKEDAAAFTAIYERYALQVYRYLYNRVNNPEVAEDLTSQVFLEALEHIGSYRPTGSFAAWLFTIARRRCVDYFRKNCACSSLEDNALADPFDVLTTVIENEEKTQIIHILQRVSQDERELLRLRYAANLSFSDIAAISGGKQAAVKMAFYRLIQKISRMMEK